MIPAHSALQGGPVYLDYNATTPVDPRVFDAMLPHLGHHFGNPSSSHSYGDQPRHALDQARAQVAALIGARPDEIASPAPAPRPTTSPYAAPYCPPGPTAPM
ncbi:aminotransferase class V-fold PLP-dependent enzyme [Streptomyces sp. NBC_00878]|uniref:aminotransferase class V-fold PLP-dependent enzyme n=1 Tax=Streptomyces sp. NBC_00878 TaxID=2975854 RepID=UPI002255EBA0|nr:aminotransferase class V-fold PLP-dependent enzyme [Streptomyces sp. NBC_00878]MCX4906964.1 aminotransferase class V-fold PLP-dependent enzyme [Streptomyces sp. NBC_00878]